MDPPDTHSFVVKIWIEHQPRHAVWQGQVTHVPSGQRRTFRSLSTLNAFITPYLRDTPHAGRPWSGWLNRWKWPPSR